MKREIFPPVFFLLTDTDYYPSQPTTKLAFCSRIAFVFVFAELFVFAVVPMFSFDTKYVVFFLLSPGSLARVSALGTEE